MADRNGFTDSYGTSISRGTRRSESTDALTLADMMDMDLSELGRLRLDELEGSSWIFRNGFNNKFGLKITRS